MRVQHPEQVGRVGVGRGRAHERLEALPPLAASKTTQAQIRLCFEAYRAKHWEAVFD